MAATHKVIVLGKSTGGAFDTFNLLFWFDITSGAKAQTAGSAWPNATAADNAAVQNGSVLEEPQAITFPAGLAAINAAAVEAYIAQQWNNRNAELNGVGPAQFVNITESPTGVWG
jgi:hypothetical protein